MTRRHTATILATTAALTATAAVPAAASNGIGTCQSVLAKNPGANTPATPAHPIGVGCTTPTAHAAAARKLTVEACRGGILGRRGTDHDVAGWQAWYAVHGFPVAKWRLTGWRRQSRRIVLQRVRFELRSGSAVTLTFRCHDTNGNGRVESHEDTRI